MEIPLQYILLFVMIIHVMGSRSWNTAWWNSSHPRRMCEGGPPQFDESGLHRLTLTIGHLTTPDGKKSTRWRCFVRPDSDAVALCTFEVHDGLSAKGITVSTPPFEIERSTACVYTSLPIEITVHYQAWLGRQPSIHRHEVELRPSARSARSHSMSSGGVPVERTEEVTILLRDPAVTAPAIEWAEYEAPPGQYLARPPAPDQLGRSIERAARDAKWAGRPSGMLGATAPRPDDWASFPSLGGPRVHGQFQLGRTPSFSSALAAASGGTPSRVTTSASMPTRQGASGDGGTHSGSSANTTPGAMRRNMSDPGGQVSRISSATSLDSLSEVEADGGRGGRSNGHGGSARPSQSIPGSHSGSFSARKPPYSTPPYDDDDGGLLSPPPRLTTPPPRLTTPPPPIAPPMPPPPPTPPTPASSERTACSGGDGGGTDGNGVGSGGAAVAAAVPSVLSAGVDHVGSGSSEASGVAMRQWLASVAVGDVACVLAWLDFHALGEYKETFHQQAIDGKTLLTLTDEELATDLKVRRPLVRRRLMSEIEAVGRAAPPPPPAPPPLVRIKSEPPRGFQLVEVLPSLELKQVIDHVQHSYRDGTADGIMGHDGGNGSNGDGGNGSNGGGGHARPRLRVVKVERVINEYLSYKLDRTARNLAALAGHKSTRGTWQLENRAVPPQGGYFHGTHGEATLSICEHGFDDTRWRGGKFGLGQYLSADASRAALPKYTGDSTMLLLVETVLGTVWHLRPGEAKHGLNAEKVRLSQYDSVAVPDTDEIVVYLRFQAIPRYIIHFERKEMPSRALRTELHWRAVPFCHGRYEQRLLDANTPQFACAGCTRAHAVETATGRGVFLKLVRDAEAAEREAAALRAVGSRFAPELLHSFELEGEGGQREGTVLVLEAAHPDSSLAAKCRRCCGMGTGRGGSISSGGGGGSIGGGGIGGGESGLAADAEAEAAPLLLLAEAQRVLQCVARVHECGYVHCDVKPEHFMRFPGGTYELKLVDFGAARRAGEYVQPGHSRRYCAPELARAMVSERHCGVLRVEPALDMWATGLVLYELVFGAPLFAEQIDYVSIAFAGPPSLPRGASPELEAHCRLLASVLVPEPAQRPSALETLDRHVLKRADDTAERKRVEIAAFFSNPTKDLSLYREIKDLFEAFSLKRRPLVTPAARLSDIARLLATEVSPTLISFSGHHLGGHLLFEPDDDGALDPALLSGAAPAAAPSAAPGVGAGSRPLRRPVVVPSSDALIRLVSPDRAPELRGLILNACQTEELGRSIHASLPHLSIVCWRGRVLDAAAKTFMRGFSTAIASRPEGSTSVATAFEAGRAAFLRARYVEGDVDDYLHRPDHPHRRVHPKEWRLCTGCNPPVHGTPILVTKARPATH